LSSTAVFSSAKDQQLSQPGSSSSTLVDTELQTPARSDNFTDQRYVWNTDSRLPYTSPSRRG